MAILSGESDYGYIADGLIRYDPSLLLDQLDLNPDPWMRKALCSSADRILMCCARQTGKSTCTSLIALHRLLYHPESLVLLFSPSQRQSGELFKKLTYYFYKLNCPVPVKQMTATTLWLTNGSRAVSLPADPDTTRGFSGAALVVVDEAAAVPDDLFVAINPMVAVSRGRLICLSTPLGKRGWYHEAWEGLDQPDELWQRITVQAQDCPRIDPKFLLEQKVLLGERYYRQEYECSFEDTIGQLFDQALIDSAFEEIPDNPFGFEPLFGKYRNA
jgi:hypothetical protein